MKKNIYLLFFIFLIIFSKSFFMSSYLKASNSAIKPWSEKVVLLKSYQQPYDWITPWGKRGIKTKTGMALVVDITSQIDPQTDNKNTKLNLLTTAEMVVNSTLIEATIKGELQPFEAKIELIDYAANLALLKIDQQNFWEKLKPVDWSKIKTTGKSFKKRINTLKIKSAEEWYIESAEIEQMTVEHRIKSNAWFPNFKIKGVSKSGQGFPVIQDNKTIGMIIESKSGETKAVPSEILLEFFNHAQNDSYVSMAHRGFSWIKIPQRSTAEYFKIPYEKDGIWISKVLPYGTGSDVLIEGDYLTKIDSWPISNEGKIKHPIWGLSLFDLLFLDKLKVGDFIDLYVIRNGEPIVLKSKVSPHKENLGRIPLKKVGSSPKYVINGGFLFQELTLNYLYMWGKNWKSRAPIRLRMFLEENKTVDIHENNKNLEKRSKSNRETKMPRIVLVTQVIPDQINIGYQKLSNAIVLKINDNDIKHLNDVNNAFLNPKGNYHRIDLLPGSDRHSIVLPINGLDESNKRIQKNFRIPKLNSF